MKIINFFKTGYICLKLPKWLFRFEKEAFLKYYRANRSLILDVQILNTTPLVIECGERCGLFFIYFRQNTRFNFLVDVEKMDLDNNTKTVYNFQSIDYYIKIRHRIFNIRLVFKFRRTGAFPLCAA